MDLISFYCTYLNILFFFFFFLLVLFEFTHQNKSSFFFTNSFTAEFLDIIKIISNKLYGLDNNISTLG